MKRSVADVFDRLEQQRDSDGRCVVQSGIDAGHRLADGETRVVEAARHHRQLIDAEEPPTSGRPVRLVRAAGGGGVPA
jgi:hypothetical protein